MDLAITFCVLIIGIAYCGSEDMRLKHQKEIIKTCEAQNISIDKCLEIIKK